MPSSESGSGMAASLPTAVGDMGLNAENFSGGALRAGHEGSFVKVIEMLAASIRSDKVSWFAFHNQSNSDSFVSELYEWQAVLAHFVRERKSQPSSAIKLDFHAAAQGGLGHAEGAAGVAARWLRRRLRPTVRCSRW